MSSRSQARVVGANDRVRIGLIGFGLIGRIHARSFLSLPDAQVVAVAEAYQPRADACRELVGADLDLPDDQRTGVLFVGMTTATAHHRFDPGDHLFRVAGLVDPVVGPDPEPADPL